MLNKVEGEPTAGVQPAGMDRVGTVEMGPEIVGEMSGLASEVARCAGGGDRTRVTPRPVGRHLDSVTAGSLSSFLNTLHLTAIMKDQINRNARVVARK